MPSNHHQPSEEVAHPLPQPFHNLSSHFLAQFPLLVSRKMVDSVISTHNQIVPSVDDISGALDPVALSLYRIFISLDIVRITFDAVAISSDFILITFKGVFIACYLVEISIEDVVVAVCVVALSRNNLISLPLEDVGLTGNDRNEAEGQTGKKKLSHNKKNIYSKVTNK